MRALWPVLGGLVILGIIFVGLAENEPETIISPTTEPTETVIIPKTFQAESQERVVDSKSFESSPEISSLEKPNQTPTLVQNADGITSDQTIISVTTYSFVNNIQKNHAFDSSGNGFAGLGNKVGRVDITSNTQTTWTLPNDQSARELEGGIGGAVDSSEFYYFVIQTIESPINYKIAKLNHNTNIFTEWPMPEVVQSLTIDSSDNLYFTFDSAGAEEVFFNKLDTNTNTLTSYILPASIPFSLSGFVRTQDSQFFYLDTAGGNGVGILRFNPATNEITHWSDFPNNSGVPKAIGNSGEIYFGSSPTFSENLAELNTSTNLLKEWAIPFDDFENLGAAVVDLSGNVFFGDNSGNGFYRFVPSTETFTQWQSVLSCNKLEISSDDEIRFACTSTMGVISSAIIPSTSDVSIPTGSGVPGCEETNACYIPFLTSIGIGTEVIWSNDDTAAHTVTSGTATDGPDGTFDSSLIMAGATFSYTFDSAGTFDYFCMVHPWQTGQVIVS